MQTNQISAGQLMMSFMSKAKDDIREGIVFNGFSKELLAQCNTGDDTGTVQVPVQVSAALLGADSKATTSGNHPPPPPGEEPAAQQLKPVGSSPAHNGPSMVDRKISEVKVREALYVSDPMVVERILAHFQLPAEARDICAGSLNSKGGVPFNTIVAVLDQYNPGGASPQGEASAGAQEAAEFVASLQRMEGPAPSVLQSIPVKAKGSYSLKEFKLLMKKAVACVNEAELKQADLRDSAGKKGGCPAEGSGPLSASAPAPAPALAHGLSTQLVESGPPLFMLLKERKAHHDRSQPFQNALLFPSSKELSQVHDGTGIRAIDDPAPLVMEPAIRATVKSDGAIESLPISSPQAVYSDPEDDGVHQTKAHEVLQALSARPPNEETAPYRLGGSNEAAIPGKADHVQENHVQEESELRSVHAAGPSQVVFAPPAAEPSGTGVEIFLEDNRPVSRVDFPPPASADDSAQKPDQPVEMTYLKQGTQRNPVEHQQPARIEGASPSHPSPSESSFSDKPRGEPIPPHAAPAMEGAKKQADERMSVQVPGMRSQETVRPETKMLDEPAISQRGSEKFSVSVHADEPAVFLESRGNTHASSDDNRLDSLEVKLKQEPGTLDLPRPDVEFLRFRESGSPEKPETLSDMAGGDTEEDGTASRLEKGPLGMDLANTSAGSNTTFQNSDRNWKRTQDPPVAEIKGLDETIPDEAAASPKAPDASASRFTLEASSSPSEPQKGPTDSLSLEDAGWPQELGRRLTQLRGKDGNRLTLELAPRHLGKLVIQVEAHRDQVIAWLSTDNEQARSLLIQNAPLLRQQLQEQGLVLGQLQVSVGQEGREKNSQRQFEFAHGKGEGGRGIEKLHSGRRSGLTHACRSADGDRRISLFA